MVWPIFQIWKGQTNHCEFYCRSWWNFWSPYYWPLSLWSMYVVYVYYVYGRLRFTLVGTAETKKSVQQGDIGVEGYRDAISMVVYLFYICKVWFGSECVHPVFSLAVRRRLWFCVPACAAPEMFGGVCCAIASVWCFIARADGKGACARCLVPFIIKCVTVRKHAFNFLYIQCRFLVDRILN